jgi:minor extracellular serine protease Vpr
MKKTLNVLALSVSAALLSMAAPVALAQDSVPVSAAEGGNLWFVELSGSPVADGNTLSAVRNEKAAFRRAAGAAGISYQERRSFDTLFNGFSIQVSAAERVKVMRLPGVKAMYPVETIQAPSPQVLGGGSTADMATALAMTGAQIAQASGLTGKGVKVGIIDTGIDLDHPDFGGSGVNGTTPFVNHPRVKYGYDFVGDAYDANPANVTYSPTPVPDANPDDCNGHGTHVAGITGANGTVKGVAPDVVLGAYRVFGCNGSSSSDVIVAAMERALADGMQVVNQSLGAAFQWPQYPTAQAADRLVNKGVVMVASIGNSGASGIYSAGAPGVGKKVIGVASFDNTTTTQPAFSVSPGNTLVGYNTSTAAPVPPTSGGGSITPAANLGCNASDFAGFPAGRIALISRGSCTFVIKAQNAQAAGASAVVLYNNAAGAFGADLTGGGITIPVVSILQSAGQAIAALPDPSITWGPFSVVSPVASAGLISSFSSYGLAADLTLKPNIGAPGGFIYSTYPLERGGFANLSGTSMSAPHVAGGVAQVLQANPKASAQSMKGRLQNHADPRPWFGNPGLGFLDNVHRQGAGMLDIVASAGAATSVEPSELSLGESQAGPAVRTLTVQNSGASPLTFVLGHAPALSTGANTFVPGFSTAAATASFSAPTVTVPANGSASVDVTLTASAAQAERGLYGGYVTLTQSDDTSKVMRVPYAGLKGDYQSFQVLTAGGNGFPWLTKLTPAGQLLNQPAGASYTMAGNDIPYFAVHLDHYSRKLRFEAYEQATGKLVGRISDDEYLPRNSTATGIFSFVWDGVVYRGNGSKENMYATAPNGTYVVKISALKALGDESNPAHWETWTSPTVTVARP